MPAVLFVMHCLLDSIVMAMMCLNWMQYQPVVLAVASAAGPYHARCLSQVALLQPSTACRVPVLSVQHTTR
jgi:hypothetical protein